MSNCEAKQQEVRILHVPCSIKHARRTNKEPMHNMPIASGEQGWNGQLIATDGLGRGCQTRCTRGSFTDCSRSMIGCADGRQSVVELLFQRGKHTTCQHIAHISNTDGSLQSFAADVLAATAFNGMHPKMETQLMQGRM